MDESLTVMAKAANSLLEIRNVLVEIPRFKMAAVTQWEIVGKSSAKRAKNPPKALTKAEKKAFAERAQRQEYYGKVKGSAVESNNIYEAFIDGESKESGTGNRDQRDRPAAGVGNGTNMNGSSGQTKKPVKPKKGSDKAKGPMQLEDALGQISVADLSDLLAKDQTTFPDNPLLWLKDFASYLNIKLDAVPEADPLFEKKPSDFPLCAVAKPIIKMIRNVLDSATFGILELFFEHCINSMISDMSKGASTYGYRIFIQLLAHDNPKIVHSNLSRYLELIKTNQNRQLRCLSIMWAIGQPGVKSLSCGLRIWIDIMFPLLGVRTLSAYAVTYLENLFSWHPHLHSAYGCINFRDFFPIFDVIYAVSGSLASPLQKRLLNVYPKVKAIAFTNRQDTTLRNFFPSFLARTSPHAAEPMRTELADCLMTCLAQDKHCFSLWRQMYTRHFTQSGFLLQRLADDFNRNAVTVDKKMLIDTVKTFNVTNEDLAAQKKSNFDGFEQCNQACKTLLLESSKFRFPWFLCFLLSLSLLTGLIIYDVYQNKGQFKNCKTHKILTDTGTLAFCAQVYSRVREYSILAYTWLEDNVPVYYTKTVQVVGPYLVLLWTKTIELYNYLVVVSAPLRAWLYVKLLAVYSWLYVNVPVWYGELMAVISPVWKVCQHYLLLVWRAVVMYAGLAWTWLQENVLVGQFSVENIQRVSVETLLLIRDYLYQFVTWCSQTITSLTK